MMLKIWRVEEPNLIFGGNNQTSDPRFGILNYGPFSSLKENTLDVINVRLGIIGTEDAISGFLEFINALSNSIPPNKVLTGVFGFPGIGKETPIRMELRTPSMYHEVISEDHLIEILKQRERRTRLEGLLEIFKQKLLNLAKKEPKPHVVICTLSKEMVEKCKRKSYKTQRLIFRERKFRRIGRGWKFKRDFDKVDQVYGDYDFHNVIKVIGMKVDLPTQIVHHDVWEKGLLPKKERPRSRLQDRVTLAWNFSMALYYKASGIPWKFTRLEEETLYAGIEFFPEITPENQVMNVSMAQIFLQTGESFILRGDSFEWERKDRSPHLSYEQGQVLIDQILSQYYLLQSSEPERVVIHKSSNFWEEELEGFEESTQHIKTRDFITIANTSIRFYRDGYYPPVRGTIISGKRDHYLYTTGYTPSLLNYPGKGVPEPLLIRPFHLDSPMEKICSEILALTKLDWNNIYYNIRFPVTLSIAGKVGEILSEPKAQELSEPLIHYRYYM